MPDQTKLFPIITHVLFLVLGALLGVWLGTSFVSIESTGIWQLDTSYQSIYVQSAADAYAASGNDQLAAERLSYLCQEDGGLETAFQAAQERYSSSQAKIDNLNALRTLVDNGQVTQSEAVPVCSTSAGGILGTIIPLVLLLALLGGAIFLGLNWDMAAMLAPSVVGTGGALVQNLIPKRGEKEETPTTTSTTTAPPPSKPASEERSRATAPGMTAVKEAEEQETATATTPKPTAADSVATSKEAAPTDFAEAGLKPPVVQFMTTYLKGDDLYDDSFSIETSSGEFLGETGVGISETIGASDGTKQTTAFEAWLFDKNDIRTVTKVIMSDHAFNDEDIRNKLAAKGEAVLAEKGKKVVLETATLRVQARIVDMEYASDAPPNSVFERITIELAAWKREDGDAS